MQNFLLIIIAIEDTFEMLLIETMVNQKIALHHDPGDDVHLK